MPAHVLVTDFILPAIGARVKAMTGSKANLHDFTLPSGDPGLFGPDSITWTVHSNFAAMMVGGLSSLIVQSLNSRALSAVWDHSDFRNKLKDRLGRTTYFVAATTYGSRSMAMSAISRVNAIHANICGTDLQGNPYIANEPALIRWVHLAEVSSFLSAYQHLSKKPLSDSECDQYVKEMSQVGYLLGAVDLPVTWQTTQEALVKYVSDLRFDDRAKEILRVVEDYPTDLFDKPFMFLSLKAAYDVMPLWIQKLIEKQPACALQTQITKFALLATSEPVQWMLDKQGVAAVARKRVKA
jgi:uncharacterized protein (DUF2236 family)